MGQDETLLQRGGPGARISRRAVLGGLSGLAGTVALGTSPARSSTTLKARDVAASRGILFGSAFDQHIFADVEYAKLLCRECHIVTNNYSFKFDALRPGPDEVQFGGADALLNFADHCDLKMRGHNLIWNEWLPDWVKQMSNSERALLLDRHIDEAVGHFAGKLHSWDVVNEPIWVDHGHPGGLRGGPWYDALGADYIPHSFRRARAADPDVKLVLNEAYLEYNWKKPPYETGPDPASSPWNNVREHFLALVTKMVDDGVPIDAVGIESHLNPMRQSTYVREDFLAFLNAIAALGLDIYITELDVNDVTLPDDPEERDRLVAEQYHSYLSDVLTVPAVKAIITWELADSHTQEAEEARAQEKTDVRLPRSLPFDSDLEPKSAYRAIVSALSGA